MIPADAIALHPWAYRIRGIVLARCAKLGPRFSNDAREDVLAEVLAAVTPMRRDCQPRHLLGGWPATEDERGFLDEELAALTPHDHADAAADWVSRVVAYARGVARRVISDLVSSVSIEECAPCRAARLACTRARHEKGATPVCPDCRPALDCAPYADDHAGNDEHSLQAGNRAAGACPLPGNFATEEEIAIARFDAGRLVTLTADFERSEFWASLRTFAATQTDGGEAARRARAFIRETATCPADLALTSDTTPEDVYQTLRKRENQRSHRAAESIGRAA